MKRGRKDKRKRMTWRGTETMKTCANHNIRRKQRWKRYVVNKRRAKHLKSEEKYKRETREVS